MKITSRTAPVALALSLALSAAPTPALAQGQQSAWGEAGTGLVCFGATLFYGTAKTFYALAGTVVGGAAYAITGGSLRTAQEIWTPALRGDYVISPQILRGERVLVFSGRDQEPEEEERVDF